MIRLRFDSRVFKSRARRIEQRREPARRRFAVAIAGEVVADVIELAPRDTNRYVRAVVQAGNAVGAGPFDVPQVRPSRVAEEALRKLLRRRATLNRWRDVLEGKIVNWYELKGRPEDQWSAQWRRQLRQVKRDLDTIEDRIERFTETSIFMNLRGVQRGRRDSAVRVLDKVYGGTGVVISSGSVTMVRLINKEPHARIVEWKFRVMRRALGRARAFGARRPKREWLQELGV